MSILGIIPARYAATRFPGKPLADIHGQPMIRRVYDQACKSKLLDEVIVATDDRRIFDAVISFQGKAIMTSPSHKNGTERCAEVIQHYPDYDYAINIQGDEPYIHPQQIDEVAQLLDGKTELATLVKKINDPQILDDPSEMKVIFNHQHEAIYFSRTCIPYQRDVPREEWVHHHSYFQHIGIYGYRRDILQAITQQPVSDLERAESLEQLRWIENGYTIKLGITTLESQMIDTPEDLKKLTKHL